ncbi:MAG TPA: SDR family NAD(P)-dependent oxidoreductase, partial [Methylomirabilota bacterium]|nr:SDR family NAD(P)-dependent oxidoreductase [Methylomirabilota bacterium]
GLAPERTYAHPFEARDRASPAAWVAATVARYGRLDGLVNNAGIDHPVGIEDEDETAIDELWEVNVKGPLRLIRAALPHLRASGCGRIVNIASLSGKRVRNLHVGYAMSKFAVMALTHTARRVAWDSGVRATAVCPGLVDTEMTADYVASVPREQMTQAGDLAHLVATALALPNHACVAELLVNYRLDDLF